MEVRKQEKQTGVDPIIKIYEALEPPVLTQVAADYMQRLWDWQFTLLPIKFDRQNNLSHKHPSSLGSKQHTATWGDRQYNGWTEFQHRHPTLDEMKAWFSVGQSMHPNYCVITGRLSGVLVVDIDGAKSKAIVDELCPQPKLVVHRAPDRWHYYYRYPQHLSWNIGNKAKVFKQTYDLPDGDNLDIRGEGGLVVGPMSIHHRDSDGNDVLYQALGEWTYANWKASPVFDPAWLGIEAQNVTTQYNHADAAPLVGSINETSTGRWYRQHGHEVNEGERNHCLFVAACDHQAVGVGIDDARQVLTPIAEASGLGVAEIDDCIESAYAQNRTATCPSETMQALTGDWVHKASDWAAENWWDAEDEPNPFPTEVLPEPLQVLVNEIADKQNVDPAIPACTAFAVVSAYMCNVVEVHRKGWYGNLPPTFWCLMIMRSGAGKSRGIGPILQPMKLIEDKKAAEVRVKRRAAERAIKVLEDQGTKFLKSNNESTVTALINCQEYIDIQKQINELKNPRPNTMLFSDATIEALIGDMQSSYHRKCCIGGESPFIDLLTGKRYGGGDATMIACDLWDGETVITDRKTSGNITVERACLTNCTCFTWDAFNQRLRQKEFQQGGFAQRFLYILPQTVYGVAEQDIDNTKLAWWSNLVAALDIKPNENEHQVPEPSVLTFTDAAVETLQNLSSVFVTKAKQQDHTGETELWRGWCARVEAYVIRLAAILHAMRHGADYRQHQIDVTDVESSIYLMRYYMVEADRVLHKRTTEVETHADIVWHYLTKNKNNPVFTIQRIQNGCGRNITIQRETTTKAESIRLAIEELIAQGRPLKVHGQRQQMVVEVSQ